MLKFIRWWFWFSRFIKWTERHVDEVGWLTLGEQMNLYEKSTGRSAAHLIHHHKDLR